MTGRDRIMGLLNGLEIDRMPWVPYIGIHGGRLIDVNADAYMNDGALLLRGLEAVHQIYEPDGMIIAFDLQIEAEALGCDLKWYKDSPPSVVSHPLAIDNSIPVWDPSLLAEHEHRIELIMNTTKSVSRSIGQDVAIYGLVCGPVTLAAHLRGEHFMMDIILNEGYVRELLNFTCSVTRYMAKRYMESGADIIAIVDPLVSQISPGHFSKLVGKAFEEMFSYVRSNNRKSALFACGCVDKQISLMAQTHPDMICIDEHTNFDDAYECLRHKSIVLSGNLPVATVMLHGTPEENIACVDKLKVKERTMILASGCDTPYDTPIENIKTVSNYIKKI